MKRRSGALRGAAARGGAFHGGVWGFEAGGGAHRAHWQHDPTARDKNRGEGGDELGAISGRDGNDARACEMVEQTARRAVGCVHWAEKPPTVGE